MTDLRLGKNEPEVGNWQRFLVSKNIPDWAGKLLSVDEDFGSRTSHATRVWQNKVGLKPSGIVTSVEKLLAAEHGFIPFVQAQNYTKVFPKTRSIKHIVFHTMENSERPTTSAESVALWFAGHAKTPPPRASAHYCVDRDSIVQCVRDMDVAWHAPGVNNDGIGIEHAGFAKKTREEWLNDASLDILQQSAKLASVLSLRYCIPLVHVGPEELKANKAGFCGHVDATEAFPGPSRTHWDPGPGFPWDVYLDMVYMNHQKETT